MKVVIINSKKYLNQKRLSTFFPDYDFCINQLSDKLREKICGRIALHHSGVNFLPSQNPFEYTKFGSPFVSRRSELYCSISHSYSICAAISSIEPIGIDIEKIRGHNLSLVSYISSREEQNVFRNDNPDLSVTKIWVLKEAYTKTIGKGLQYSFPSIKIKKDEEGYRLLSNHGSFYASVIEWEDNIVAVCSAKKIDYQLQIREII